MAARSLSVKDFRAAQTTNWDTPTASLLLNSGRAICWSAGSEVERQEPAGDEIDLLLLQHQQRAMVGNGASTMV